MSEILDYTEEEIAQKVKERKEREVEDLRKMKEFTLKMARERGMVKEDE